MTQKDDNIPYRVHLLEEAVAQGAQTAHEALEAQRAFNTRVEVFMQSIRVWGFVALLIYGTGQGLLIAAITRGA